MKMKGKIKEGNVNVYSILSSCSLILLLLPEDDPIFYFLDYIFKATLNTCLATSDT